MGTAKRERQKANRAQKVATQAVQTKQEQRRRGVTGFLIVIAAVVVIGGLLLLSKDKKKDKVATSTTVASAPTTTAPVKLVSRPFTYGTGACPAADGSSPRTLTFKAAPKNCLDKGKEYTATLNTTAGTVVIALDTTATPGTVNNFVVLSKYKYYDDNKIFRISPGIDILQSGSPHDQAADDPGPGYSLQDEGKMATDGSRGDYTYKGGEIVMARGSGPNSASAQFFLTTGAAASGLDATGNYVVFGKVTSGLDLLQKIQASIKVTNNPFSGDGEPNPAVTIKSVTITEK